MCHSSGDGYSIAHTDDPHGDGAPFACQAVGAECRPGSESMGQRFIAVALQAAIIK